MTAHKRAQRVPIVTAHKRVQRVTRTGTSTVHAVMAWGHTIARLCTEYENIKPVIGHQVLTGSSNWKHCCHTESSTIGSVMRSSSTPVVEVSNSSSNGFTPCERSCLPRVRTQHPPCGDCSFNMCRHAYVHTCTCHHTAHHPHTHHHAATSLHAMSILPAPHTSATVPTSRQGQQALHS